MTIVDVLCHESQNYSMRVSVRVEREDDIEVEIEYERLCDYCILREGLGYIRFDKSKISKKRTIQSELEVC